MASSNNLLAGFTNTRNQINSTNESEVQRPSKLLGSGSSMRPIQQDRDATREASFQSRTQPKIDTKTQFMNRWIRANQNGC